MRPTIHRRRGATIAAALAALAALVLTTLVVAGPRAAADAPAAAPNDPLYAAGRQWNIDRVKAPQAWDLLPPGGNTVVAVLDTGIDMSHPDLAGRISPFGCDAFHDRCSGGSPLHPDVVGHGTHVSGILGANTNNGIGVASVSGGRVTILPVQISSTAGAAFTDTIAEAIVYAVDHGAQVINISFGGQCGSPKDEERFNAITYAEQHDVLIVLAAGNSGGCREGRYPQSDSRVMSVAATDISDRGASFTDRGLTVSVAAPGVNILSTVPRSCGLAGVCDPSGYFAISGTSMSAPHVAAAAALLFQVPGATKAKVVDWIMRTCDSADVSARCGGRINVYRAVSLAMTGVDPEKARASEATSAAPSGVIQLARGCNNVSPTVTESSAAYAARMTPQSALVAIWEHQAATNSFGGFSTLPGAPNDLTAVTRLRPVFVCLAAPATLEQPTT